MAEAQQHRILRQVLELELGSAAAAPRLQQEIAGLFQQRGASAIEALFDSLVSPETLITVPRLELDLGPVSGADWQTLFVERLVDGLREALADAKEVSSAEADEGGAFELSRVELTSARSRARKRGADVELRRQPRAVAIRQQLLFFLVEGHLPWWGEAPTPDWVERAATDAALSGFAELRELVAHDDRALARLVDACAEPALEELVRSLAGPARSRQVLELLTPEAAPSFVRSRFRRYFWQQVLRVSLAGSVSAAQGRALLVALLAERRSLSSRSKSQPARLSPGERRRIDLQESSAAATPRSLEPNGPAEAAGGPLPQRPRVQMTLPELPEPWRSWLEALAVGGVAEALAEAETSPPDAKLSAEVPGVVSPARRSPTTQRFCGSRAEEQQAIYLGGAGIVILHPFLEELFRSLGLLEGRSFASEEARQRAVHLLGFLSFGVEDTAEHELLLAKLLCGMPWSEVLPPSELGDVERAASTELMLAVLGHWQALKSSSPEWLRLQFFPRLGKLEPVDDGFRLTVERKAQDILLDRLPWGLGVIRLAFMQGTLHVQWS